jgi:SPOR domain
MSHRWYFRSSAALVITLFANVTLTVPGLEAAGLLGTEQRFGVDQDGNLVKIALPARVAQEIQPPSVVADASKGVVRYGVNQNGELRPLVESAPVAQTAMAQAVPPAAVHAASAPVTTLHPSTKGAVPVVAVATPRAKITLPQTITVPVKEPGIVASIFTKLKSLCAGLNQRSLLPTSSSLVMATPPQGAASKGVSTGTAIPASSPAHTQTKFPLPPRPVAMAAPRCERQKSAHVTVPADVTGGRSSGMPSKVAAPRFSLKIDSLKVRTAAHPLNKKLAENGVSILESKEEQTALTVHRLVVGTFATQEEAQECLSSVKPKLKNAYIMSHNGKHGVYCGSFYKLQKAREKIAELRPAGVRLTILQDSVAVKQTTILAGSYISRDAAQDISMRLRRLGIPAAIVPGVEALTELRIVEKKDRA